MDCNSFPITKSSLFYTQNQGTTPQCLFTSSTSFLSLPLPHSPLLNAFHTQPIPPAHLLLAMLCPLPTT